MEIKFRFWDKTLKKMCYRNPLTFDFKNESIVPLQFTGLIDKNEVEIYVGDYLADYYPVDEEDLNKGYHCSLLPVSYDVKNCQFVVDVSFAKDGTCFENIVSYFGEYLEVKGNVYNQK